MVSAPIKNIWSYLKRYKVFTMTRSSTSIEKALIINVCNQLKPKLIAEDQLLLLLRFMEFAHGNNEGLNENLAIFHKIATIFNIDTDTFDNLYAFVVGKKSPSILTINADDSDKDVNHIYRRGLEGEIRVLRLTRFDRMVFIYQAADGYS